MQHHEIQSTANSLSTQLTTIERDQLDRASGGSPAGTAWDIAKNTGKAVGNGISRAWYRWNSVDEHGVPKTDVPKYNSPFKDNPVAKVRRDVRNGATSVVNHIKHWL